MMRIRLKESVGGWPVGSVLDVVRVIPHGGHTDEARQFEVQGQTFVLDSKAEVLPEPALELARVEVPSGHLHCREAAF